MSRTTRRPKRFTRNPLFWLLLALLTGIFVGPLMMMVLTSFKTRVESQAVPPTIFPQQWTTEAYHTLFSDAASPILQWFGTSLLAATLHSLLVALVCSMAGYSLARMHFRGRNLVFAIIISTLFIPGFIFLMPNFEMMSKLSWLDTLQAIVVPNAAGAFGVFFMRQFFLGLPIELEESARIDGAGAFTTFFRIVLPNAKAAVTTLIVLSFLTNWNDFVWPLYVLYDHLTLPIGLSRLQGSYTIDYPVIMAGATIAAVPVIVLYAFVQRYIIQGIATSGLK